MKSANTGFVHKIIIVEFDTDNSSFTWLALIVFADQNVWFHFYEQALSAIKLDTTTMDRLETFLRTFKEFTEQEIQKGLAAFEMKQYKKDELLIQAGSQCNWVSFVCSGILRNYYTSNKGEEITYCITFPGKFLTAYSSFISETPTFENIHALTDVEALVISRDAFNQVVNSSPNWLRFAYHLSQQSYIVMEQRLVSLQMVSAEERYDELMTNHPEFIQNIPLKYLASYLGITQRHLSRIRKR